MWGLTACLFMSAVKYEVRTSSEVKLSLWSLDARSPVVDGAVCLLVSIAWCALPGFYMSCHVYCADILLSFEFVLVAVLN